MSSSTPILNHKFLLDENVNQKLYTFLKKGGFDVKISPKAASDRELALISKKEKRILVTNDEDFIYYSDKEIFSIVWLRIVQGDVKMLVSSFEMLLNGLKNFSGRLVILEAETWRDYPLVKKIYI